jgi:hypothetical protein
LAKVRFGDREMSKVGTKAIDRGLNGLKLVRGWGSRIVWQRGGIRSRLNIWRGHGLVIAGDGFTRRIGKMTVIFRWIVRRAKVRGASPKSPDDYLAGDIALDLARKRMRIR